MKRIFYRNYKNKVAIIFSIAMMVLASVCPGIFTSKAVAAGDASVYFDQTAVTVNIGDTVTLVAKLNPGTASVNVVDLAITYDSAILQFNSATKGSAWGNGMDGANTSGNVYYTVYNTSGSVTTISDIATFTFTALASGSSSVLFGSGTTVADNGNDVIGTVTGATITVGSPAPVTYNATDFAHLLDNWLQTVSGGKEVGNLNTDNIVNTRDLGIMMSNWAL